MADSGRQWDRLRVAVRRLWGRAAARTIAVKGFLRAKEAGASILEYALLLALIAMATVAAMTFLSSSIANVFNNMAAFLGNAVSS